MKKEFKNNVSKYAYEKYLKKYDPDWEPNQKAGKQARAEAHRRWWASNWLSVIGTAAAVIGTTATIIAALRP